MSAALDELLEGTREITILQQLNPDPVRGGGLQNPQTTRVLGRAETMLLASHFERYIYSVFEESADCVLSSGIKSGSLPTRLKLVHSRSSIDAIFATQWDNRADKLSKFLLEDGKFWNEQSDVPPISGRRLLEAMKSPVPDEVRRAFRIWDIDDVFASITRSPSTRQSLLLILRELVEKRNGIAHGDFTVESTHNDVRRYEKSVVKFCSSVDLLMARQLKRLTGLADRPW